MYPYIHTYRSIVYILLYMNYVSCSCIISMYHIYIHIYTYFHMQYSHGSTITIDDRWRADMSANKQ